MKPVLVHADRRLVRSDARSRRHVRLEITAPEAPPREGRVPVNLAFVVDRSGSMAGDKIEKAREAAIQGIRALRIEDRFAVVAYDDQVEVVVPSTEATPESRAEAERRIAAIDERGSTDLCGGWTAGCDEVARALGTDAVGRCLLLTDGLANQGVTEPGILAARADDLRRRRIATSALGIGADFDEALLAAMAEAGGGNFHFVKGAAQIPGFLAAEVGEALAVTAREVALVVEAGPGVRVASLNGFPCTREGGTWRVEIGALFGGQVIDPVLRLAFPPGDAGAPGPQPRRQPRRRPRGPREVPAAGGALRGRRPRAARRLSRAARADRGLRPPHGRARPQAAPLLRDPGRPVPLAPVRPPPCRPPARKCDS